MSADKILFREEDIHGTGDIYFVWQPGASALLLATTGSDGSVAIFNRKGELQERIILQGLCSGFSWDIEGDFLAIITSNSSNITLWDANSYKRISVDTGLRDPPSCLVWSKRSKTLAVATSRGNLAIYNHQTARRIPILGKHSKRITCGAWSSENLLALGSEDKSFSLSNEEGDSLRIVQLRDTPSDMYFAEMKTDEKLPGENTVSMILGKRTLFLYHLPEPDSPTELGFQQRYGSLLQHKWFGDGYILLGFSLGHIVAMSTHPREVGQELWQVKNHRDTLTGIAVSAELQMVASCGDNNIKIHSMVNLQETVKILSLPDQAAIKSVDWSTDGQLLAVTTTQGSLAVFVTKLQLLRAVCPPRIAILSSLAEVSVYNYSPTEKHKSKPIVLQLEIEPLFLAVGKFHLACGMNNHIWYYDLGRTAGDDPMLLGDREYMAEIKQVAMNGDHVAVLCGGQVMLHTIETKTALAQDQDPKIFPDEISGMQETVITCLDITNDFLCYATDLGEIVHFSLKQWETVLKYRHQVGIRSIHADKDGSRLAFIDDQFAGYVYIAASQEVVPIKPLKRKCEGVLWDQTAASCFVAYDEKTCTTYSLVRHSVYGKQVKEVGDTEILSDQQPIMLYDGDLCLHGSTGKLVSMTLSTHKNDPTATFDQQLALLISLQKFDVAFDLCRQESDGERAWKMLADAAISNLNIDFALKVYRKTGNISMVYALEEIRQIEDLNLLKGYCAMLLAKIDEAKIFFAKSSNPQVALELCRDLLQWEEAIALAGNFDSDQVPFIAREYAQQLEFTGSYVEALLNYEMGLRIPDPDVGMSDGLLTHVLLCKSGIARTSIKTGDYKRGIKLAVEINDKNLFNDCAEALASAGHTPEAAILFEKAENFEMACSLYIQQKQFARVDVILPHVTSSKLHGVYAKAKESEGRYKEAINSYRLAGDLDSVVRIYLDQMSDPHSASEIVLESRSIDGARMLARFYQQIGDFESALQFLILCGCLADAFTLAQKHNKLKHYGQLLEQSDNAKSSDFMVLAKHFESEKYTLLAGKFYFLAKEYAKSLKFLLKASTFNNEENVALSLAIDCVATSNDEKLVNQLIEFLLGENDGTPKDPKLLFRLYMARKQYREAAKTAVIIASQEQLAGNYRSAHDLLFSMYQELKRNRLEIAAEMKLSLNLLHRYILVRTHVKMGNHLQAAKLLEQVAKNISQFTTHLIPILTSTVLECHRSGLKKSAFANAVVLMRPENRNLIDPKYAKKIEGIVRKAPKGLKDLDDDSEIDYSPCAVCGVDLATMETNCFQCKTTLPICIASGCHVGKDDMVACPECEFPAMKAAMISVLEATKQCPMCDEHVDSNRLTEIDDISAYI